MNPYYEPYWTDSNSLEHYGVLGMKWGVRRYQPYPKGKHGTFLGQSRDEDIRIKKGTAAYRLQEGSDLSSGQKYVSFDRIDHVKYIAGTAACEGGLSWVMMRDDDGNVVDGKAKSLRMELTEDIVAPSYQAAMDAFIKTMDEVKLSDIYSEPTSGYEKQRQKEFLRNVKRYKVSECRDAAYTQFVGTFMRDTKAKDIFFKQLKDQGYNAIVDENDKQFGKGFTESPVILFDSSSVKVKQAVPITGKDAEYFSSLYFGGGYEDQTYPDEYKRWSKFAKTKLTADTDWRKN